MSVLVTAPCLPTHLVFLLFPSQRDESGLNRKNIVDNRVHCCFYFVNPYGHGLKPLDIEVMKQLSDKVSIVPVIAKADCLSRDGERQGARPTFAWHWHSSWL